MAEKIITYDIDGFDMVTNALIELFNSYPARGIDKITFSSLAEDEGITIYPTGGAVVQSEVVDVTGWVTQKCIYPLMVVYRSSGLSQKNKIKVKEWLDNLGRWLEKQPIMIENQEYQLTEYPALSNNRRFEDIARTSPAYLAETNQAKVEDWAIAINAIYSHVYQKI